MSRFRSVALLTGFLLLPAVSGGTAHAQPESSLELVYGFLIREDGLVVQVMSHGCTTKESFLIDHGEGGGLGFVRAVRDDCDAFLPYGVELSWTYAELRVNPSRVAVYVANPVAMPGPLNTAPPEPVSLPADEASAAADSTLARVSGFLHGHGTELSLCRTLLESMPPGCGDGSIPVDDLDRGTVPGGLSADGDLAWSHHVTLDGVIRGGRLTEARLVRR
jgi:hypothetical protein